MKDFARMIYCESSRRAEFLFGALFLFVGEEYIIFRRDTDCLKSMEVNAYGKKNNYCAFSGDSDGNLR